MKRIMCICIAAAMTIGASAQAVGACKAVGKAIKGIGKGAVISVVNGNIPGKVNTATTTVISTKLTGVTIPGVQKKPSLGIKETLDQQDSIARLRESIMKSIGYSFGTDSMSVTFVFQTDSTALCMSPKRKETTLKQLNSHPQAKPGEQIYQGKTAFGEGVYIFTQNYSLIRFYRDDQSIKYPLLYPRKLDVKQ